MEMTQMPPVHAANLVANSDNTVYRVEVFSELKYLDALKIGFIAFARKSERCAYRNYVTWKYIAVGLKIYFGNKN